MKLATVLKKIEDYKKHYLTSPLRFQDMKLRDYDYKNKTLEDLVIYMLELAETHGSVDPDGDLETRAGARRSSLDIWRHIIFVRPEVTLPEVLQAMYDIKDQLSNNICFFVSRRVFIKSRYKFARYSDGQLRDEYGLTIRYWNIRKLEA